MAMTIKDIAQETGYAISTVSRALNNRPDVSKAARERILACVEEHGFVPNANARQLKQLESRAVCIVVKGRSNLLFASIVERMQTEIEQAGYAAMLAYVDEDDDEVATARRLKREAKPLGFVFLGGNMESFRAGFGGIKLPGVLVTNPAESLGFDNLSSVSTDDTAAAAMAIEYLLAKGHRSIGILGGNPEKSFTSRQRLEGCRLAFARAGLPFDEESAYQKARFSFESGHKNMLRLLEKRQGLTAVFAFSDNMAVGALRAARDKGLSVPRDISILGFDGTELAAWYNPRITTVQQGHGQLADRGVEIILRRIQAPQAAAVHERVPCAIAEGESVRAL